MLYFGLEGRNDMALDINVPHDTLKEGMVLDIAAAVLEVAIAFGDIRRKQASQQVARGHADMVTPVHTAVEDLLVEVDGVLVRKRRAADEHLVDEDTQTPPVDGLAVALGANDLGGQVIGGAAHGPRNVGHFLGKAKIDELDVTIRIEQNVLRLQVAVRNIALVQVLERHDDLGRIKPDGVLIKPLLLAQNAEHLAARDVFHDKEEVGVVLEGVPETDKERMVDIVEDRLFVVDVLRLAQLHDLLLFQGLDGTVAAGELAAGEMHSAKVACAERVFHGIVIETVGFTVGETAERRRWGNARGAGRRGVGGFRGDGGKGRRMDDVGGRRAWP